MKSFTSLQGCCSNSHVHAAQKAGRRHLFLRQVKSHPGCHGQKAARPMSQAHGEATYKLTSLYCKWVGAATSNIVPLLGLTGYN
jgi:hypothetical protein